MTLELARQKAAQAWCTSETKDITMIPELAFAFADIIETIWSRPWLGNATTEQLIDELKARIAIGGDLSYKPSDDEQEQVIRGL